MTPRRQDQDDQELNGGDAAAAAAATTTTTTTTTSDSHATTTTSSSTTSSQERRRTTTTTVKTKFEKDWVVKLIEKQRHYQQQQQPNSSSHNSSTTPPSSDTAFVLRNKILAVAPMVDQSDLPFRLLCRRYGANVAFTPMIHTKLFVGSENYRCQFFNLVEGTSPDDRPLIAQLCGSDPELCVRTARLLEQFVDGIDVNCGCPQGIAKRGNYGAFLLEQPHVLLPLIATLVDNLSIPVSVKVRILPNDDDGGAPNVEESLKLYQSLVNTGIGMLTIHGRTRYQKGRLTGRADWHIVKCAVDMFSSRIPVLCNGSMASLQEIRECLAYTNADGVMCSEALLEYPPIYVMESYGYNQNTNKRMGPGRVQLATEYMELAKRYPPNCGGQGSGMKCIKAHVHKFLHADLQVHTDIRTLVVNAKRVHELEIAVATLAQRHANEHHNVEDECLTWYVRHQAKVATEEKERLRNKLRMEQQQQDDGNDDDADTAFVDCTTYLFGSNEQHNNDDDGDY